MNVIEKTQKKIIKLKNKPKLFILDSFAYKNTAKLIYFFWIKFGHYNLVLLITLSVALYYLAIASPVYVNHLRLGIEGTSYVRELHLLKDYINSTEMAEALNEKINLKSHYQSKNWDIISRLNSKSNYEEYVNYFKNHITAFYDEKSETLKIDIQAFNQNYALNISNALIEISKSFIDNLDKMVLHKQLDYAQKEVDKAYDSLKKNKINTEFEANSLLITDIYKSSIANLANVQRNILNNVKHLLVVEHPTLLENAEYPKRYYNIISWFTVLTLVYCVIQLIAAAIKEHTD